MRRERMPLPACALAAALGLAALGGAGFGLWLLILLDGGGVIQLLLTALAGFGVWSLLAAGFGLALLRAWDRDGASQPGSDSNPAPER